MNSSSAQIPIHSNPERPIKRHHTPRYYAHRVRESLATRVSKLVCTIFLSLLFIIGIISFILWLSLRPHRPRFHMHDFSIPIAGFENAHVNFNVTARNPNQGIGIYYDAMQVALFYDEQSIGSTSLLNPFYQEPKNTTVLAGDLITGSTLTVTNQMWQQIMANLAQGTAVFRLELTSTFRFKISSWDSRHHRMHANCPVGVGTDGLITAQYKDKRCPVYFS